MPFLDFLFSPQAHKFRDGYSINHDTLMNGKCGITQSVLKRNQNSYFTLSLSKYLENFLWRIARPTGMRSYS